MNNTYTEEQVIRLLEEQKRICAREAYMKVALPNKFSYEIDRNSIINAPLATGENNYVVIEKEKFKEVCTGFFFWWYNQPGSNTYQGFDKYCEEVLKEKLGIDLK